MYILLKIILGFFVLLSSAGGWLLFREFKLFNKNVETSNTSLFERMLINLVILIGFSVLITIFISSIIFILSNIIIQTPF